MKIQKQFLLVFFTVIVYYTLSAQSDVKADAALDKAKKAIAASNAIYFTSFTKNDSTIFISRYAKDACLLPSNTPKICGHNGIAKFFRDGYNYGLRSGKFKTIAVYGDGKDFVTEEGTSELFYANGDLMDSGKYLVLWKNTPEGWKMFIDSFNSDHVKK